MSKNNYIKICPDEIETLINALDSVILPSLGKALESIPAERQVKERDQDFAQAIKEIKEKLAQNSDISFQSDEQSRGALTPNDADDKLLMSRDSEVDRQLAIEDLFIIDNNPDYKAIRGSFLALYPDCNGVPSHERKGETISDFMRSHLLIDQNIVEKFSRLRIPEQEKKKLLAVLNTIYEAIRAYNLPLKMVLIDRLENIQRKMRTIGSHHRWIKSCKLFNLIKTEFVSQINEFQQMIEILERSMQEYILADTDRKNSVFLPAYPSNLTELQNGMKLADEEYLFENGKNFPQSDDKCANADENNSVKTVQRKVITLEDIESMDFSEEPLMKYYSSFQNDRKIGWWNPLGKITGMFQRKKTWKKEFRKQCKSVQTGDITSAFAVDREYLELEQGINESFSVIEFFELYTQNILHPIFVNENERSLRPIKSKATTLIDISTYSVKVCLLIFPGLNIIYLLARELLLPSFYVQFLLGVMLSIKISDYHFNNRKYRKKAQGEAYKSSVGLIEGCRQYIREIADARKNVIDNSQQIQYTNQKYPQLQPYIDEFKENRPSLDIALNERLATLEESADFLEKEKRMAEVKLDVSKAKLREKILVETIRGTLMAQNPEFDHKIEEARFMIDDIKRQNEGLEILDREFPSN